MTCRMCKGDDLTEFLDLGFAPPADQFLRREQLREPEIHYPLTVVVCGTCGLAQLGHVVSPEVLYRHDYPYEASLTRTGREHWAEFAETVASALKLGPDDLVVDIGSNVGVLLEAFKSHGTRILGVDPASNIVRIAERRGIETLNEFFGVEVAQRIVREKGPARVVTGTNVVAHIDDVDAFIKAVKILIGDSGTLVIEAPYFPNLVKNLEYDTIYHEHVSYLSVRPLVHFLARHGMEIFDVQERDIHGGSFRVFAGAPGRTAVAPIVNEMLAAEAASQIHALPTLRSFAGAVAQNRRELVWLLQRLTREGKRIVGVSGPAKGMTLLNYCRIGPELLDFVTEKSTLKIGRFTPGGHIPVVPDSVLLEEMPDYGVLLAWNFAHEIMENLREYRQRGGKFIIPIPTPTIVQ
jgi:hypothetical protein